MTKKYKLTAIALGVILLPSLAYATTTPVKNREQLETAKQEREQEREQIKDDEAENRTTIKQEMEQRREEVRAEVQNRGENIQLRIENRVAAFASTTAYRHQVAIQRLENITQRIEARIVKFEEKGTDQTEAEKLISAAREKITLAKSAWEAVRLWGADSNLSSKENYNALKELIDESRDALKEAHAALVEAVKNIKPGQNATTTPSN